MHTLALLSLVPPSSPLPSCLLPGWQGRRLHPPHQLCQEDAGDTREGRQHAQQHADLAARAPGGDGDGQRVEEDQGAAGEGGEGGVWMHSDVIGYDLIELMLGAVRWDEMQQV